MGLCIASADVVTLLERRDPTAAARIGADNRDVLMEVAARHRPFDGGLFPLAQGLLHADESVRSATLKLLQALERVPETKHVVDSLNPFLRSAYRRMCTDADGQALAEKVALMEAEAMGGGA